MNQSKFPSTPVRDAYLLEEAFVDLDNAGTPVSGSYQYSEALDVAGLAQITCYLDLVLGAATDMSYKWQFSPDGISWYDDQSGVGEEVTITGDLSTRLSLPVCDAYLRLGVKGTAADFSTTTADASVYVGGISSQSQPSSADDPAVAVLTAKFGLQAVNHLIDSGAIDNMGSTFSSSVIDAPGNSNLSLELYVDNTDAVGSIAIEGSNSQSLWVPIVLSSGLSSIAVSSGVDVEVLVNLADIGFRYLRVTWTRTSGDGQFDCYLFSK